jgi:Co/Zn/Cd efflux system component
MIAILIGCEYIGCFFYPVPIHFAEAIPIACAGLAVNDANAWLLSGGDLHHGHSHGHVHDAHYHDETKWDAAERASNTNCRSY